MVMQETIAAITDLTSTMNHTKVTVISSWKKKKKADHVFVENDTPSPNFQR